MSHTVAVSETASAPHNDIEQINIANLNRPSLPVQPRRKFCDRDALIVEGGYTVR